MRCEASEIGDCVGEERVGGGGCGGYELVLTLRGRFDSHHFVSHRFYVPEWFYLLFLQLFRVVCGIADHTLFRCYPVHSCFDVYMVCVGHLVGWKASVACLKRHAILVVCTVLPLVGRLLKKINEITERLGNTCATI